MPWESSSRARGTAGAVLGTSLLESLDPDILSLSLAGMIGLYILVYFLHPSLHLTPATTRWTSPPVGAAAGVLQGATGISGPLISTYLHGFRLEKEVYVLFHHHCCSRSMRWSRRSHLLHWVYTQLAYFVLELAVTGADHGVSSARVASHGPVVAQDLRVRDSGGAARVGAQAGLRWPHLEVAQTRRDLRCSSPK